MDGKNWTNDFVKWVFIDCVPPLVLPLIFLFIAKPFSDSDSNYCSLVQTIVAGGVYILFGLTIAISLINDFRTIHDKFSLLGNLGFMGYLIAVFLLYTLLFISSIEGLSLGKSFSDNLPAFYVITTLVVLIAVVIKYNIVRKKMYNKRKVIFRKKIFK
ncbi:MAG: hypothetical protein SNG38_00355 [Rikenellaceae bacterium]